MPQFRLPDGSLLGADAPVRAAPAAPAKPAVRFRLPDGTELDAQDVSAPAIEDLPTGAAVDRYEAENPGFGNRTGQRLAKGVRNLQAGVNANDAVNAQRELELLDMVEAEANRGEANQKFRQQLRDQNGGRVPLNRFRSGERTISVYRGMTPEQRAQARQELQASLTEGITGTIRRTVQAAAIPSSPAATRIAEAESFGEGVEQFTEAPLSAMGELVTSSLPAMAPGIAAAIITKRPALSMGGGSAYVESVSSLVDGLQKAGVNVMDEAQVLAALQDPAIREQIAQDAQTRGIVIGIVDALAARAGSMVLAPKSLSPTAREVVNIPSQVVAGVGSGMAGEAGAQIATEGSVTEPGAVVAEGVGEGPTQVVEVGVGVRRAAKTPSDETPPPEPAPYTPSVTPVDEPPLTRRSLEEAIKANDLSDQGQVATSRPVAPAEDPEGVDVPETANAAPEPPESVEDPEDDAAILAHAETVAQELGFELDDETRQDVLETARNGAFVEDVLKEYADNAQRDRDIAIFNSLNDQGFAFHGDENATEENTQPGETADRSEGSGTVPTGARPLDGDRGRGGSPAQEAGRDQGEASGREAAPDDLTERRERHALYNRIRAGRRPTEDGSRGFSMIQEIIRRGGVDPDSPLASEFRGMDVMNPRFFRRGGMKDVDDFHVSDLGLESVFPNRIEDGRLDPQDVFDLVNQEKTGQRVLTDEDAALNADSRAADFDELARILDQELGLDIEALSNAEVDRAQDIASQLPAGLDRDEIGARITRQIMRERAEADPDDIQAALTARTGEVATSAPPRTMEKAEARETVRRYNPSINKVRVGFKNKTEAAIYMVAAARKGTKNADAGRAYLQDQGYSDRDIDTMARGARASVRDHLKGAKPRKGKVLIPAGTISDEFTPVARTETETTKQEEPKPQTPRVERAEPEPAELASLGVSREGTVNGSHIADMQDQREVQMAALDGEVLGPEGADQAPQKPLWEMSPEELDEFYQSEKAAEDNIAVAVLGKETAARWEKLQRQANSMNPEVADRATDELGQMDSLLSEAEYNRLYGMGEEGDNSETIRDFQRALSQIDDDSAVDLGRSLGIALTQVGQETNPADMRMQEQMAWAQLRHGFDIAQARGFDQGVVMEEAIKRAASRFYDPDDAAFMLRRFINESDAPMNRAPSGPLITEQTDQGEQNVIPGGERLAPEEVREIRQRDRKTLADETRNVERQQSMMRGRGTQKPADEGLFGNDGQSDLLAQPADQTQGDATPDVQQAVIDEAERLGLGNIVSRLILNPYLRIGDKRVAGAYDRGENLLFVALAEADPKRTLRHEAIHAMRHMNVITRKEWGVLARKAHKTWRKQYDVDGRWGNFFDGWPDDVVQDKLTEEGVAEAFADHVSGARKQTGTVAGILNRMAKFIEALGNALRGLGFRTYEDVFNALDRGERVAGKGGSGTGTAFQPAPPVSQKMSERIAEAIGGTVLWDNGSTSLIEAPARGSGVPLYVGANSNGQYTTVDIRKVDQSKVRFLSKAELTNLKRVANEAADAERKSHEARPDGPFKNGETIAFSPNFPTDLAGVAREWLGLLGLDETKFYFTTFDDAGNPSITRENNLHGPFSVVRSLPSRANDAGVSVRMDNGVYLVGIKGAPRQSKNLETLAHEIGHVLEKEGWASAGSETQQAIVEDYKAWLSTVHGKNKGQWVRSLRAHVSGKLTQGSAATKAEPASKLPPYWRSFSEWFADQTARWATSEDAPRTVVEKFFARLGAALRRLYASAAGKASLPSDSMREYLNSLARKGAPLGEPKASDPPSVQGDLFSQIDSIDGTDSGTIDPRDDVMLMPVDDGTRKNGGELFGHVYDELSVHNSRILANSNKTLLQRVRDLQGSKTKPIALAVRRALMDSFVDLQEVQANLERESDLNHLPEHQDANMAQELYRSRTGNALINARQNLYEPLIDRMKELDVDVETLETYLVARHAEERNNQIARINPDMPDGGSGMTTEDANRILESIGDRQAAMDELAGMVDGILAEARRLMVHYGLESQETIDTWEGTYKNYVPLRGRDFDEESVFAMPGEVSMPPVAPSGPNFSVRGPEAKRAMGRGENNPAVNVLAYALQIHQSAIVRGEKNRVGQTLMNLVNDFPDPDFWTIDTPTEKRVINPSTGLVTTQEDPLFANRDDVVHIKVDGVGVILHLKHAPLAKAMRNIGNDSGNMVLKVMQQVNIWLSLVNTAQNPEFVISNFFRDLQTAFINMSEDDLVSVRTQTMKDIKKAWSGLRNLDKGADTEWAGYAKEFGQAGGRISFMGLRSVEQEAAKMRKAVKQSGNLRPDQYFMKVGGAIFDLFERHNGYIENAVRLSAYVNLRRAGAPPAKAAQAALNLTVNFNRKGTWGTALNSAYLFYNATVQGNLRIAQALLRSQRVRKMVAGIVAAGFMADMMNAMMAPDDDDDDNSYDRDIPEWVKQTNMVVMLGKGEAIKVPMPYGYNWFWNVGRNISAATRRQMGIGTGKKPLEAAADIGISLIDTFNPLGGSESLASFVSPTIADPFVAWGRNEDFAGRPIRPENPTFGTGQPDSQMYWNSTGEIPKFVADKMNRLTGGNEFVPGAVDVSPDGLEYVFEFATGAAGAFWNRNVNNIITIANGEVPEIRNVPFVRKVWQGRSEYLDKNRFYERHAAIDLAANNVKNLRKTGKFKEATRAYREQDRLVRLKPVFDNARRQLQKVSQQKQIVRASDRPNKQALLDRLAAAEKRILDRANGAFNRLRADEQE